jgi:hypothetical protein
MRIVNVRQLNSEVFEAENHRFAYSSQLFCKTFHSLDNNGAEPKLKTFDLDMKLGKGSELCV